MFKKNATAFALISILSACGGGSSDSGSSNPTPEPEWLDASSPKADIAFPLTIDNITYDIIGLWDKQNEIHHLLTSSSTSTTLSITSLGYMDNDGNIWSDVSGKLAMEPISADIESNGEAYRFEYNGEVYPLNIEKRKVINTGIHGEILTYKSADAILSYETASSERFTNNQSSFVPQVGVDGNQFIIQVIGFDSTGAYPASVRFNDDGYSSFIISNPSTLETIVFDGQGTVFNNDNETLTTIVSTSFEEETPAGKSYVFTAFATGYGENRKIESCEYKLDVKSSSFTELLKIK